MSIIIPVYNSGKYIEEAILSVKNQNYTNTEVIIIDDGSTDNSYDIAVKFKSDKLRIVKQANKGASAARNLGLDNAAGKYIQFLDADDFLSPDKIEAQVRALQGTVNKLAVCSTIHFKEKEDPFTLAPSLYEEQFVYSTDDVVDFTIKLWGGYDFRGSMIQTNAWLIPQTLISENGGWNEDLTLDDDGEFFARMILNSKGIIKTKGYNYYRKHETGLNLAAQNNEQAFKSALTSALLKKKVLFEKTDNEFAKRAVFRQLKALELHCYAAFPTLRQIITKELSLLPNYKFQFNLGGRFINIISLIFGWKFARKLQFLKHKI